MTPLSPGLSHRKVVAMSQKRSSYAQAYSQNAATHLPPNEVTRADREALDCNAAVRYARLSPSLQKQHHRLKFLKQRFAPCSSQCHPRVQLRIHRAARLDTARDAAIEQLRALATPTALAWFITAEHIATSYENDDPDPTQRRHAVVAAYARLRREGWELPQSPDGSPLDAVVLWIADRLLARAGRDEAGRGKRDENGYVKHPTDPAPYWPAAEIIRQFKVVENKISDTSLMCKFLNKNPTIRWTRPLAKSGKPHPRQRSIHLNDLLRCLDCKLAGGEISEAGVATRTEEIRSKKHAG